jgi:hypothetical protein
MREPKRLLSSGATDFERRLLSAVANERPSALLRSRMRRGLGLLGPVLWAGNVKAMLSALTTKGGALAATVGGVVAAGGLAAAISLSASHQASVPALDVGVPPAAEVSVGQPRSALPLPSEAPAAAAQAGALPPVIQTSEPKREDVGSMSSALREEIAVLDQARAALQQGDRKQARAALKLYARRFPDGVLRREAALLGRQRRATSELVPH